MRNGALGLPVKGGSQILFLWLKRSPRSAIAPISWGRGGWVTSGGAKGSDDPTQLDKPVEVGSVVQHLPDVAVSQHELNARQFSLLGQSIDHVR